ncbi:MAG: T9SS type A sorting domain-containing protein [Flavobacterium sp.]|uniref:T9SS type A sorting domain-containing protein n=1 Tax=Flavobacterium sp. TaxID=239 RepID=UPI0025BCA3AE|nr:T9SS type A sorting domain-containing protein [Flavobacterium sp.]MCK6608048.1 T9SS type A sorting domain-containing protein [Flavobacterium sp.]
MKIKKLLVTTLLLGLTQVNAQEAVVTSGGNTTGTNGNVSYSVGQIVYTTNSGATGSVAQGVQQPFEIQTLLGAENFNINLQLAVYPNPTTNWLQLEVKNTDFINLSYQLFDLNGRMIYNQKITAETSTISMEQLPAAFFLLKVVNNNKEVKTFKIIKKEN